MHPQNSKLAFKAVVFAILFALVIYLPRYESSCKDYEDHLVESALQEGGLELWLNHACRDPDEPLHKFFDENFPHPDIIEPCFHFLLPEVPLGLSATHFSNAACKKDVDTVVFTQSDGSSTKFPHYYYFAYRKNCNFRTTVRVRFISWSPYWAFFLSLLLPLPLWTANSKISQKKSEIIDEKAQYQRNGVPWWYAIPMGIFLMAGEFLLICFAIGLPESFMSIIPCILSWLILVISLPTAICFM